MAPKLLFADNQGRIYEHPRLETVGFSADNLVVPERKDFIAAPSMTRLYYHPKCPPFGFDRKANKTVLLSRMTIGKKTVQCNAVSAFIQQGWVRTLLPAMNYKKKDNILPMWAYSAVGSENGRYYVPAFEIDDNPRWHPDSFDDRKLLPEVDRMRRQYPDNRLIRHLKKCACRYHCFAAKNFFLRRWEAPVPVSPACNAACLGCISLQPDGGCINPQDRISFVPDMDEICPPFTEHLETAPDPIISFGQGCEGEPILQWRLICSSIEKIRSLTDRGTINLNTNGSKPDTIQQICNSGLDSIRISLNSARRQLYDLYYRPVGYRFEDVSESIKRSSSQGVFTMINYLVFPGLTDTQDELEAFIKLIDKTSPNMIHFKNLNIDPDWYQKELKFEGGKSIGLKKVLHQIQKEFPEIQFGYYNRTKENFYNNSSNTGGTKSR